MRHDLSLCNVPADAAFTHKIVSPSTAGGRTGSRPHGVPGALLSPCQGSPSLLFRRAYQPVTRGTITTLAMRRNKRIGIKKEIDAIGFLQSNNALTRRALGDAPEIDKGTPHHHLGPSKPCKDLLGQAVLAAVMLFILPHCGKSRSTWEHRTETEASPHAACRQVGVRFVVL
jgi:hypothetical protein